MEAGSRQKEGCPCGGAMFFDGVGIPFGTGQKTPKLTPYGRGAKVAPELQKARRHEPGGGPPGPQKITGAGGRENFMTAKVLAGMRF